MPSKFSTTTTTRPHIINNIQDFNMSTSESRYVSRGVQVDRDELRQTWETITHDAAQLACEDANEYWKTSKRPSDEEMNSLVGPATPIFDEFWGEKDEQALVKKWLESREKNDMDQANENTALISLWNACLQMMRCSPVAILSPRRGFAHLGTWNERFDWSQGFCTVMKDLVVHPLFCSDIDLLALMLQFTVICRTDDRRLWKMRNTTSCLVLHGLEAAITHITEPLLPKSIHAMHVVQRTSLFESHGKTPSLDSDLMFAIGERYAEKKARPAPIHNTEVVIYGVTVGDLNTLKHVMEQHGEMGTRLLPKVSLSGHVYRISRTWALDLKWEQVVELHGRAWLHEMRESLREVTRTDRDRVMHDDSNDTAEANVGAAQEETAMDGIEQSTAGEGIVEIDWRGARPPWEPDFTLAADLGFQTFERKHWRSGEKIVDSSEKIVTRFKED